jgi:O-Antigen ligase
MFLGIGRNLPNEMYYAAGVGLPDLLLIILMCCLFLERFSRVEFKREVLVTQNIIVAVSLLGVFAMVSLAFNAFIYKAETRDIFEIFKYYYQIIVMLAALHCTRTTGSLPAFGFVFGALITGVVALLNPMNPDVLGVPQIFNPNVIGNVLAISIVMCSTIILQGRPVLGVVLAVPAAVIGFFTFSKGTWLMCTLAVLACYLALTALKGSKVAWSLRWGQYVSYVILAGLVYGFFQFSEVVSIIIEAKIAATDFEASAAEGGSFSARWGLIIAAIQMFLMNPLVGVGISNYEFVNRMLESQLGDAFYDDDNPNSAWFYVLGCMGLPAFVCFALVFYMCIKFLNGVPIRSSKVRTFYVGLVGLVIFIGGNVQLEMLTAYYYWVLLGILAGWQLHRSHTSYPLKK